MEKGSANDLTLYRLGARMVRPCLDRAKCKLNILIVRMIKVATAKERPTGRTGR